MEDNAAVMAQEPVVARPMTSYSDVMGFLHSIRISEEVKRSVAQRLMEEVTGKNLSKAFARLDHLCQLKDDWDGYGGRRISYQVIDNLRQVLLISDDKDWENWMISPEPSGTLALQSKEHIASISVGDEEFSYYSSRRDKEDWADDVKFEPNTFLDVMRRIV